MARIRFFRPEHNLVHVTFKCVDDQCLLVPSPRSKFVVARVLHSTMRKYSFELFAICVMGNHIHMILHFHGSELAKIMQFFKSRLAMEFNALLGRSGAFWKSRYRAHPILDEPAFFALMNYVHANPVRAHLVEHAKDWPGFSSYDAVVQGDSTVETAWLGDVAWTKAGRPRKLHPFIQRTQVTLSKPSPWRPCSPQDELAARCAFASNMSRIERETSALRRATRVRVPSRAGLAKWDPRTRPSLEKPAKPQPWAFGSPVLVNVFRATYRAIVKAYRNASARFRASGILCPFPTGTFPPRIPLPMEVM